MALDTTEKDIINFGKTQGKSEQDILRALAKYRSGQIKEPPRVEVTQPPERSFAQDTALDVFDTVENVRGQFAETGQTIVDTATSPDLTVGEKARGIGSEAFRGASRAFGETILGIGKAVLPQRAEEAVGEKAAQIGQRIGETETVQNLVSRYQGLSPDVRREVDNALGFAEGLADIATFGAASQITKAALRGTIESAELGIKGTGKVAERITPTSIKNFQESLNPSSRDAAIKNLTQSYKDSFVVNRKSISDKLEKQARRNNTTVDELLGNLAREGYVPKAQDKLAKFDEVFTDIDARQSALFGEIDPLLAQIDQRTTLTELRNGAEQVLRTSPQVGANFNRSVAELDAFIDSFRNKFQTEELTAQQVNEVRKNMNAQTKAFGDDAFKQDTADALADATRDRLDEIVPTGELRQANAEWARLENIERTARALHNQQIDVGIIGRTLGSYAGTVVASGLGLSVGGPGGLVIAGLAARYGGDAFANFIRRTKFSDEIRDTILQNVDDATRKELINSADRANKTFLQKTFDRIKTFNEETQIGLSTKDISVTPESVAKKIDKTDRDIIARFLDNPNELSFAAERLLEQMKIGNAPRETQVRFLQEVLNLSNL